MTPQGAPEETAQMRAESALDAALHHMHAPQQQGDRAGKIDQRQGGVHLRPSRGRDPSAAHPSINTAWPIISSPAISRLNPLGETWHSAGNREDRVECELRRG